MVGIIRLVMGPCKWRVSPLQQPRRRRPQTRVKRWLRNPRSPLGACLYHREGRPHKRSPQPRRMGVMPSCILRKHEGRRRSTRVLKKVHSTRMQQEVLGPHRRPLVLWLLLLFPFLAPRTRRPPPVVVAEYRLPSYARHQRE